jgi:hypothetical protein
MKASGSNGALQALRGRQKVAKSLIPTEAPPKPLRSPFENPSKQHAYLTPPTPARDAGRLRRWSRQPRSRSGLPKQPLTPRPGPCRLQIGDAGDAFRKFRNVPVPEGHVRIAQRFNAGNNASEHQVPKGRLNPGIEPIPAAVPSGPEPQPAASPTLKRWAILARPSGTRACWRPVVSAKGIGATADSKNPVLT